MLYKMYSSLRSPKSEGSESFTRQGSLRRVIPAESKEDLFGRQNEDLNKIYKNFHQEYIILAENKMVQSENIPGVYVIPSKETSFVWFGVVYVRSGPYEDGIFRFSIFLDENFPESEHPKVVFQSEVTHPVIDANTNELHLLDAFPTWNKSEQHIWQVLKYIHWIFNNINSSLAHAVNKEIVDLYKHDRDAFKEQISAIVKLSQERIYDEPPTEDKHYIQFSKYEPSVHDSVKRTMLVQTNNDNSIKGHSWVLPGSFKPLGRPHSPDFESES